MQLKVREIFALVLRYVPVRGRWRFIQFICGDIKRPTPVIARIPHVGVMELDLSSDLEREIFVSGTHGDEHLVSKWILKSLVLQGSVFVDVGANVGYHTIRTARHLRKLGGSVIAFEPIQANFDRLLTNVRLNKLGNIRAERIGLADKEGDVEVSRSTQGSSNFSLGSTGEFSELIHLVSFDDYIISNNIGRIDSIKLDIEGAEVRALRGMQKTIERLRPVLIVEINPMWTRRMGTSTTELIDMLSGFKYILFSIKTRDIRNREEMVSYVDPNGNREINVIAIPKEKYGSSLI